MDTYCWIHSTFTLPKFVDSQVAPGVGPVPLLDEDEVVEHKYYQWVCFTLFLQVRSFLLLNLYKDIILLGLLFPYSILTVEALGRRKTGHNP